MKKTSYQLSAVLLLCLCLPLFAFAAMQPNFPNDNPLQPLPSNVKPDINRNVNSTGNGNRVTPLPTSVTEQQSNLQSNTSNQGTNVSSFSSYLWPIAILLGVLAAFFGIYWWLRH